MIRDRDRKRIKAIIARYETSLTARIDKLTAEQREEYALYCWRLEQWKTKIKAECPDDYEGGPDAYFYARSIEAKSYEPRLDAGVSDALYGNVPRITRTINQAEAMRKYMDYMETGR